MAKLFHILVILCLIFPSIIYSETNASSVKVAFIRDGYLWMKIDDKEEVLTVEKATYPYPPLWSFDGNMLLYQKEVKELANENRQTSNQLWVYDVKTKKHSKIFYEVIWEFTPKWAYSQNLLGYIAGGGRIIFSFKNKNLKVTEIPIYHSINLTPKNYAEMDFSWVNDSSLIVSRVKESEWSNDAEKRPKASLYFLTLTGQKQLKITAPPKNKGDYKPEYLPSIDKITWLRKSDFVSAKGDLWVADIDGGNANLWIRDIGLYTFFPSE